MHSAATPAVSVQLSTIVTACSQIASAATAVVLAHIAGGTNTIRIGAGGIMLPNHAPLAVAEAFGTLATVHGPRIDLGLGRAPGGDGAVMQALRRGMGRNDDFPNDVVELLSYLGPERPGGAAPRAAAPGAAGARRLARRRR